MAPSQSSHEVAHSSVEAPMCELARKIRKPKGMGNTAVDMQEMSRYHQLVDGVCIMVAHPQLISDFTTHMRQIVREHYKNTSVSAHMWAEVTIISKLEEKLM